jgi:GPH family glycoside/pentoside/hexuronide:cation symporter
MWEHRRPVTQSRTDPAGPPEPAATALAADPGVDAANAPLATSTLWAYCLPMVGIQFMWMMFGIYFMKYSTDVLLVAPAVIGGLFLVARVWDAISDPLAGYLSDRSNSKRGRRRSWMYASALPILASTVMLWAPPTFVTSSTQVIWIGLALLLYETAYTAFFVPWGALGMELTSLYHERTRLFGYRHVIAAGGSALGLGGVWLLRTAEDPRAMALALSLVGGAVVAGLIFYSASRLPERAEYQGRGAVDIRRAFGDVLRNKHGRLLFFVFAIENLGSASIGMLAPYVMQYVVNRPDLTEAFILVYFVPQFALTPIWIRLSRRFGKKRMWLFAMAAMTVAYAMMYLIGHESYLLIFSVVFLLGLGGGCGAVVGPSIQADVIDYDEYLTGERKEGAYVAIWNFIRKLAAALTAGLTGIVLQYVGYVPNVEDQTQETKDAMLALIGLLPAACYFVGTIVFSFFGLNEKEHASVVAALLERRASAETS